MKPKKRPFLRRTNRTAPAPLGPSPEQILAEAVGKNRNEIELQQRKPVVPTFCKKQAFTEEIITLKDGLESPETDFNKVNSDKSSLFCVRSRSASSEQLENLDSAVEVHMTNSADSKKRRKPFMGKLSLVNSQVLPGSTETSLSNVDTFASSGESDRVTVIKQLSSGDTSFADGGDELKEVEEKITSPIKPWDIDRFSLQNENSNMATVVPNVPVQKQSSADSCSRQNSGKQRLQKQPSLDEESTSSRSRPDSQQLSDSGFVSPKNILPPLRPNSSVDRPPWILPPITSRKSQGKY